MGAADAIIALWMFTGRHDVVFVVALGRTEASTVVHASCVLEPEREGFNILTFTQRCKCGGIAWGSLAVAINLVEDESQLEARGAVGGKADRVLAHIEGRVETWVRQAVSTLRGEFGFDKGGAVGDGERMFLVRVRRVAALCGPGCCYFDDLQSAVVFWVDFLEDVQHAAVVLVEA